MQSVSAAPRPLSTTIAPQSMSVSAPYLAPGVANPSAPCGIAARSIQPQPARPDDDTNTTTTACRCNRSSTNYFQDIINRVARIAIVYTWINC